jgi:hypothetical protein
LTVALAAGALCPSLVAHADQAAAPADAPRWELSFAPYVWGMGIEGEVSADRVTADVDASFSDILDDLNFGLMGTLEARRGRLWFALDGIGSLLSDDVEAGPVTVGFGPATVQGSLGTGGGGPAQGTVQVPRVNVTVGPAEADIDATMVILGLVAGWRALSEPVSGLFGEAKDDDPRRLDVDLFAGGRYWYLKTEIDLFMPPVVVPGFTLSRSVAITGRRGRVRTLDLHGIEISGVTAGGIDDDFEASTDWIDPIVGLRLHADVTPKVGVTVLGDLGGFGIGSASRFTWQAIGLVTYDLSERWVLQAGYRALGLDRDAGVHADFVMHGPIIGATFKFSL